MPAHLNRVVAAEAVSNFGSMLSRLAIPWIAALALDASPLQMGLLVVADVAAGAAGALFMGVVVDRHGKRAVMIIADVARAAILAIVAVLAWAGRLDFALLVAASAASGLATTTFEMARSAWIAHRIDEPRLPAANARIAMATSISETLAFALGGWLYQLVGAVLALATDALTYLLSAVFLRGIPGDAAADRAAAPARERMRAMWREAKDGMAAVTAVPALRTLAAVQVLIALGMSLAATSYMIFVARDLAFDPSILGMIFATGSVGSLAGAAVAAKAGERLGTQRTMLAGLALFAIGAACIPLAPSNGLAGAALLIAHQVLGDAGHALFDVHDRTTRQVSVDARLRARADAGIRTLAHVATLVGALAGGAGANALGARHALALSAALYALAAVWLFARPVESRRNPTHDRATG